MAPQRTPDLHAIAVIAPNLKRRLSGVTATVVRLVPLQARMIGIAATGPGLPSHVPHVPLWRMFVLPRDRLRVWHARRNTEMAFGLILRALFRRRLALLFTSASQRLHTGYTRWLIARMDGLVATSGRTARYLERPAVVIHHGIDTEGFSPADDRAALRRRLGLPERDVILGCFGRIRAQKGTDAFVDAAIALLRDRPGVTALVMGRATEGHDAFLADLRARAAAAGLADRILFLPEVPVHAMADWYRALDLYVAPQRWEGFGLTPLEAMACGVPVVATRVGAFEEIVTEETGSLVPPGDVVALAAAAAPFLDDAELRRRAGLAALERVRSRFRIEDEALALVAVYRRLLDGERW
ncbi:MAG: glycosyltransferase family 4 protein [Albidovulum sp.]